MNKFKLILMIGLLFALNHGNLFAQDEDPSMGEVANKWINGQAEAILKVASEALELYPPQLPDVYERKLIMLMLDGILIDKYAAKRSPIVEFFHSQVEKAVTEMKSTTVTEGAIIWRIYDMGAVVKTASVTLCFDMTSGRNVSPEWAIPDNVMEDIVTECDVNFVSHKHNDHADSEVAKTFHNKGKPVVAPEAWSGVSHDILTILDRDPAVTHKLPVKGGAVELDVIIYPGTHNGKNNVSLVYTPEGMGFLHTGDHDNPNDFDIDNINQKRVDVLIVNWWAHSISRLARGVDPELVLPFHRHEMGHSKLNQRGTNWESYLRYTGETDIWWQSLGDDYTQYPMVLMTYGEKIHYDPDGLTISKPNALLNGPVISHKMGYKSLEFTLTQPNNVMIEVYETNGNLVDKIIDSRLQKGPHVINLDNLGLSSGSYLFKYKVGGHTENIMLPFIK